MPKFRKPWFRASRKTWYVELDGRQQNLGPDKDAAFEKWHQLQAASPQPKPLTSDLVVVVIDLFLDYVKHHRSADTYRWYRDRLDKFCNFIDPALTITRLKPLHVQRWIDSRPELASGSKRNLCRSVQRAMKWAEEQGYVDRSPLAHFRKPRGGKKEQVVSLGEFKKILRLTGDKAFRDLLVITWLTGARPQETLRVEARHVDLANGRWLFPASEAKGGRIPRAIYLPPKALIITRRLMRAHPAGPLFRNTDGLPWTPDATNCRFQTIKKKLKVKYSLYALRHTWVNRKLLGGVDAFTVATLAGHSDPSMLAKYYAHLSQAPAFLAEQARRASA